MNLKNNKSIYSTAIISKIIIVLLSIITSSLINRILGVTLKGEYAYITNLVSIFTVLFSFGLGQTYSTYKRNNYEKCLNIFTSLTIIHFFFTILVGILLLIFGCNKYIYISIILSSCSLLKNNFLYFSAIEDVKKRDYNNIIYKLIYTFLVIITFLCRARSLTIMLILYCIEDVIIIIGILHTYKLRFNISCLKELSLNEILKIYKTSFMSMLMILMMSFNYNIDIIVLKLLSSNYFIGLYSIGIQLANMIWLIPDAFKDILFFKTAKEDSINEIVFLTKINIYINIIIIIGFVIFGKIFIYIMYGKEYIESYFITILLFIGAISMTIYKLIHPLYIAKGKQKFIFVSLLASVIINIIFNFILIPKFNIIGAAISSIFSYSLCGFIFLIKFCNDYNIKKRDFVIINKFDLLKISKLIKRRKYND